jgi:distribution and morphology protein 10
MGLPLTPLALSTEDGSSPESPFPGAADDSGSSDSVIKVRVDSAWNIRLLWEGRVKDLLVSAGVGLGPAKRSASYGSGSLASAGGDVAAGRSGYGWTGVGVSVLYSS